MQDKVRATEEYVKRYEDIKLSEFESLNAQEQVDWVEANAHEATRLIWYLQGKAEFLEKEAWRI